MSRTRKDRKTNQLSEFLTFTDYALFIKCHDLDMEKLTRFWFRSVSPRLATLIAAIGTVGLMGCLLLLLILGWLSQEVLEKESFQLDTTLLLSIHRWANPRLDQVMLSITRLGDPEVVVVIVIVGFGWLLWRRRWAEAKMFTIACLGAAILNQGLKLVFARPRPLLWTRLITETSYSFPSGHALGALVLYGFWAYVLATRFPRSAKLIYAASVAIVGAIGLSRLYLGVHYPTDIFAGYAIGFLWLIICIVMLKLQTPIKSMQPNR